MLYVLVDGVAHIVEQIGVGDILDRNMGARLVRETFEMHHQIRVQTRLG